MTAKRERIHTNLLLPFRRKFVSIFFFILAFSVDSHVEQFKMQICLFPKTFFKKERLFDNFNVNLNRAPSIPSPLIYDSKLMFNKRIFSITECDQFYATKTVNEIVKLHFFFSCSSFYLLLCVDASSMWNRMECFFFLVIRSFNIKLIMEHSSLALTLIALLARASGHTPSLWLSGCYFD